MNTNTALAVREQRRRKQCLHTRAAFSGRWHGDLRCQAAQRSNPSVKRTPNGLGRLQARWLLSFRRPKPLGSAYLKR